MSTHPSRQKSRSTTDRGWGNSQERLLCQYLKKEVIPSAEYLQRCAEQETVYEAAKHAKDKILKGESTEAILLVDTANTFNYNRKVFLHDISILCPAISTCNEMLCSISSAIYNRWYRNEI